MSFKNLVGPIYLEEVPDSADMLLCESGTIGLVLTQGSGPPRGEKLRSAVVSSSGDLRDL